MRDPFQWSIGIGRWGGIAVRLHVFFLAFAAATLYFCWPEVPGYYRLVGSLLGIASAAIACLFLSVLIHELSHALVAKHAGVPQDTITIGPLGGLTAWRSPADPRAELAILVVGPLANLALALSLAMVVMVMYPEYDARSLWNPLQPSLPQGVTQWLTVGLWINWLLFLINLLPAHPFDGGRILRAVLLLTRPAWSERRVAEVIGGVAVTLSVVFAAVSAVLAKHFADAPTPIWSVLLLLAVVLLVSARREILDIDVPKPGEAPPAGEHDVTGVELDAMPHTHAEFPEPPAPGLPWAPDAEESGEPADLEEEIEAEEERQVDGILSRLHAHGMRSLTVDERKLLDRVSARYRSRLGRRS